MNSKGDKSSIHNVAIQQSLELTKTFKEKKSSIKDIHAKVNKIRDHQIQLAKLHMEIEPFPADLSINSTEEDGGNDEEFDKKNEQVKDLANKLRDLSEEIKSLGKGQQ